VTSETKIVLDDFLEYLGTGFSREIKFGFARFFKVWSISEANLEGAQRTEVKLEDLGPSNS